MNTSRSHSREHFSEALETAKNSDLVILFLGEESILSGEAHCRTNIKLPGNQEDLIKEISKLGKPIVLVILAGRPLALENILDDVDAILYCFHPGSMAGPAISDLLFGIESPSGKLPVTFPRVTGQIPIYYSHRNTGKPATPESFIHIDDINPKAPQLSVGNTSFHLDTYFTPLFPFGYGKSYTSFEYSNLKISAKEIKIDDEIEISADLSNTGNYTAEEVVQLYIRDLVGSVTRPVKELKGFKRIKLNPGEKKTVVFKLHTDELAFYNRKMKLVTEPGKFNVWIGGSSDTGLSTEFEIQSTD
jgi:beta-glucosidase